MPQNHDQSFSSYLAARGIRETSDYAEEIVGVWNAAWTAALAFASESAAAASDPVPSAPADLSLAKAKALLRAPTAGKALHEAEGDYGSAVLLADHEDLLIVVFSPERAVAESGRDALLKVLAFACESAVTAVASEMGAL